ncbi:DUF3797 domain-containing protein [Chryseobacterium mucoviscidosis]|nr:DUF3797 domain-containing protein [Chryseobacterium mucoviscidosis]
MDAATALELAHKYTACPDCGNTYVGDGEGTIKIDENLFQRSCKCGWKVTIKDGVEVEGE